MRDRLKRRLILFAAAVWGGGAVAIRLLAPPALAVNQNPVPGSVWTWLGPSFGADWVTPGFNLVTVRSYGAKCDGVSDDAAAIQSAIEANPVGQIMIPAGTCRINSTLVLQTGNITLSGVNHNISFLRCRTGATDCIKTNPRGGVDTLAKLNGVEIKNLTIDASGQTGGNAVGFVGVNDGLIENVYIHGAWNGLYFYNINNVKVGGHSVIDGAVGDYLVKWDQGPATVSDQLVIDDLMGNCFNHANTDGIVWDGNAHTLTLRGGAMLSCRYGLHIQNSRLRPIGQSPLYLQATDWSAEGGTIGTHAVYIEGGANFQFENSNLCCTPNGSTVQINADSGKINSLYFSNSAIHGAGHECVWASAWYMFYSNTIAADCSRGAPGTYPAMEFTPTAHDVTINGGLIGDQGTGGSSYAVQLDAGAWNINIGTNGTRLQKGALGRINDVSQILYAHPPLMESGFASTSAAACTAVTFVEPFSANPVLALASGGGLAAGLLYVSALSTTGFDACFQNSGSWGFTWTATGY